MTRFVEYGMASGEAVGAETESSREERREGSALRFVHRRPNGRSLRVCVVLLCLGLHASSRIQDTNDKATVILRHRPW